MSWPVGDRNEWFYKRDVSSWVGLLASNINYLFVALIFHEILSLKAVSGLTVLQWFFWYHSKIEHRLSQILDQCSFQPWTKAVDEESLWMHLLLNPRHCVLAGGILNPGRICLQQVTHSREASQFGSFCILCKHTVEQEWSIQVLNKGCLWRESEQYK